MFMIFMSLAMIATGQRRLLAWLAIVFGFCAVGVVRIGMGGHFASAVIFAAVLMAAIAAILHWLVFTVAERHAARALERVFSLYGVV